MTKDIANQAENVHSQIEEMIKDNTKPGQIVLLIGVGNSIGVPQ